MEGDDVFITKLDIGLFIVLVTLINELIVFPIFETLKNRLTNAIAIHKIANAQQIVLRSDRCWTNLMGVADNVKTDSLPFCLAYLIKVLLRGLIIGMLVYWESSANEVTVSILSNQQLAQGKEKVTGIRIMSPMPFTGLSENEIIRMVTFRPFGVEQSGSYVVLDGEKYSFSGDDACTSVTDGRLTLYLSRAEIREKTVHNICLDGTNKRPTEVAAELNIQSRNQTSYALSALILQSLVATDGLSVIYKVTASHNGNDKEGYAALTKNSHQNGNTVWSFYGVLYSRQGNNLEYLNIPVTGSEVKPCGDNQIGTWSFSEGLATCPDGTEVAAPEGSPSTHVVNASWVIPSSLGLQREVSRLALQWVAETPFSDYVAKTKFAEEVWSRINRQVYFVSDFTVNIELPNSETAQYTQTSRKRVIITSAALSAVLLLFLIFLFVEKMQMWRHNIKMDFCDIGSVLGMWRSEMSGKPTCAVGTTSIAIGLTQGGGNGQHIGSLNMPTVSTRSIDYVGQQMHMFDQVEAKTEMSKRDPKRPLE